MVGDLVQAQRKVDGKRMLSADTNLNAIRASANSDRLQFAVLTKVVDVVDANDNNNISLSLSLRASRPHSFQTENLTANLTANLYRGHGKVAVKFAVKFAVRRKSEQ